MTIRLQRETIDIAAEVAALTRGRTDIGAVVTFTGICRGAENGDPIAARAAIELETRAGIPSCTLDALLTELDRPDRHLPPRAVVVVDEAAMVDTRRLARLITHTERASANLAFDSAQH